MASTKIQNLPIKSPISSMKIPTGGFGDYSITVSGIGDFIIDHFNLATKEYVDTIVVDKEDKILTTGGNLVPVSQLSDVPDTNNETIDEVAQALLDRIEYVKDNFSSAPSHNELTGRSATGAHPSTSISHKSGTVYTYLQANETDINQIKNIDIPFINQQLLDKQDLIESGSALTATPSISPVPSVSHVGLNSALQALLNRTSYYSNHSNLTNRSDANSHPATAISYGSGNVGSFLDSQVTLNASIKYFVNPKMFGAVGDGIADDAQAIRDCFNFMLANSVIFYDYSWSKYRFESDILVLGANKRIDIYTNCSFISNTSLFKVSGEISDLGNLTSAAAKGSKSITEAFSVSSGDLVAIHNTVNKSFANHRDYYTDGEFKTVLSVSGGVITFNQPLETSYSGLVTDKFYKISPVELHVNGLTIESNGAGVFNLSLAHKCEINNTNVRNLLNASNSNYAAQFDRVVDSKINGGEYIKRGISGTGTDYGMSFSNCQDIENCASYAYGGRHGIAKGGTALSASVPCRRVNTIGTTIENEPSSQLHAADFHGNVSTSYYQFCNIIGRVSLSGFNNAFLNNFISSPSGEIRVPIGYSEVVGGYMDCIGNTILSTGAASGIAGWLASSQIPFASKPTTFRVQDVKFEGNPSLVGIIACSNMPSDSKIIVDGFELTGSAPIMSRLLTYTAGTSAVQPSYIQITRPNYAVPEAVLYIAGDATLTNTKKNVFPTSGFDATNGAWIKNSDGTMICTNQISGTIPMNTAFAGGGYKSDNMTWTFPKVFVGAAPRVQTSSLDNSCTSAKFSPPTTSNVVVYGVSGVSFASTGVNIHATATGRHLT